jgi:hypothetical protein
MWLEVRRTLRIGALLCVIEGPTQGRPWSPTAARATLRRLAVVAGVRRRFAPHQYADLWVMPTMPGEALHEADSTIRRSKRSA